MTNPSSRESKRGGDETVVSSKLAGLIIGIIIISVLVVLGLFVVAVVKKMPEVFFMKARLIAMSLDQFMNGEILLFARNRPKARMESRYSTGGRFLLQIF